MSLLPLLLNRNRSNRPTLNLEFTANPVPASVTFTRATTATYVNSAGSIASAAIDTPRIDYDASGNCKGLLIEEARTRLNTASLLPVIAQNVTVAAVAHTISFYGTGTVTLSGVSSAGPAVGTGAYPTRTTLTFTPTAGTLTLTPSGSVNDLQLEAGSFATSIIRGSEGSQVTRAADVAVMTGSNFSSWYSQTAGTFVVSGDLVGGTSATFPKPVSFVGANVDTDYIAASWTAASGPMRFGVTSGGVATVDISAAASKSAGASFSIAATYAANDASAAFDGTLGTPDTSVTLPTVNALLIGGPSGYQPTCNCHIKRLTYYPTRLPNATLVALSA